MNDFAKERKCQKLYIKFEDILRRYALLYDKAEHCDLTPSNEEIQFVGDYDLGTLAIKFPELAQFYIDNFDMEKFYY